MMSYYGPYRTLGTESAGDEVFRSMHDIPRIGDHAGIGGRSGHNVGCDWGFNGGVSWGCGSDLVRHSSLRSRIS